MTEKVVSLSGSSVAVEVNDKVVERLEILLEEAKSGRLISLAYAGTTSDGAVAYGYDHRGDFISLVGSVSQLSWSINRGYAGGAS